MGHDEQNSVMASVAFTPIHGNIEGDKTRGVGSH